MTHSASQPRPSDKWIPISIIAFFLFLISGSIVMVVVAHKTFPGVVTDHAYEKGIGYNTSISAGAAQKALGWRHEIDIVSPTEKVARVRFVLRDNSGKPIDAADVKVSFVRPTKAGYDQRMSMTPSGNGTYVGEASLPLSGVWDVQISVLSGTTAYQAQQRGFVK